MVLKRCLLHYGNMPAHTAEVNTKELPSKLVRYLGPEEFRNALKLAEEGSKCIEEKSLPNYFYKNIMKKVTTLVYQPTALFALSPIANIFVYGAKRVTLPPISFCCLYLFHLFRINMTNRRT